MGDESDAYCILVAEEAAVVEPSVCIPHTQRQTGPVRVRRIVVGEIHIVCSEIGIPKRIVGQHRIPCRPTPRQARIQIRRHSQHRRVRIISRARNRTPDHVDGVGGLGRWVRGLAKESERPAAGDVELFAVVSGGDEDRIWSGIVGNGGSSGLDCGMLLGWADEYRRLGAAGEGIRSVGLAEGAIEVTSSRHEWRALGESC